MRVMITVLGILFSGMAWGQEGAATLPANYRVTFENQWVKVTSVRYEPMQKLPAHTHTPNPSAYVYLNDGPPVIFRHTDGKRIAATRPATKAGAFRVYRGLVEVHEVENTGPVASEFLRVEFKTAVKEPGSFWGKFERPAAPTESATVQFDHPQLKISRVWAPSGQALEVTALSQPMLLIALGKVGELNSGQVRWVPASTTVRIENSGNDAADLLQVDFKTRPSS